ncbi:MAG TPA: glutamyl-tRNA reductase [Bacteroidia bacterium]|nr:glutamyl-tRNA reductase [Bacteroidia bacterium]
MNRLKIIAITHKSFNISDIGQFHIEAGHLENGMLGVVKTKMGIDELMFLSTCNRVEFLLSTARSINKDFLREFIQAIYPQLKNGSLEKAIDSVLVFEGQQALKHLFGVSSSIDSLVVGEREIITQVRNAYELCKKLNLTGDMIRITVQKAVECAKEVYTHTNIARHPVSVVSLAYRKLRDLNIKLDAKILIVGSGVTNASMAKYLKKHGFTNFVIFNRTLANAQKLANELNGKAFPLTELKQYRQGFDMIVTCTGAAEAIITKEIYTALIGNDKGKKVVIDLAIPNDLDAAILKTYDVHVIGVNTLQEIAKKNLAEREKELVLCEKIINDNMNGFEQELKERKVELAMSNVPKKVKEIKDTALNEVFAKEINKMDETSKETLEKVISYLEKKYISMPMKMAKEIMLNGKNDSEKADPSDRK